MQDNRGELVKISVALGFPFLARLRPACYTVKNRKKVWDTDEIIGDYEERADGVYV